MTAFFRNINRQIQEVLFVYFWHTVLLQTEVHIKEINEATKSCASYVCYTHMGLCAHKIYLAQKCQREHTSAYIFLQEMNGDSYIPLSVGDKN